MNLPKQTRRPPRARPHWKTATLGALIGASVVGGVLLTNALAVHNAPFPFELDGNVTQDGALDDWQNVFELGGVTPPATGMPTASSQETFIRDLPNGNGKETQYNAGKDTLDLDGWTRKEVNKVVPDKDNITNAYAKHYQVDHDGNPDTPAHSVIYFGADRYANNGDAALGFWFFQNPVELTGTNGFSPLHSARDLATGKRGDILVQVDFVRGGKNSEIQIFEWVGSGGSHGPLDELQFAASNGTVVCTANDAACAVSNDSPTPSYWPYTPKFGTSGMFPAESFYEGAIDITALAGDVCFSSFLANTRTSHAETADLKDLALGDFNTCGTIDLVRKECKAVDAVSPKYIPDLDLFQTVHEVTILNDGGGSQVYDVALRDNSVGAALSCQITAIEGGTGGYGTLPIDIDDNATFYKVADALGPGVENQMKVTLLCQSALNDFRNSATVRAGQTPGGTGLTDTYTQVDVDFDPQCVATVNSALQVTKSCDQVGVTLDPDNGFKPKVCVDISLENTGEDWIDMTEFKDVRMDGTMVSHLSQVPGGVIKPGVDNKINFTDCYIPLNPDANQTDPGLAMYGDAVTAKGRGRANPSVDVSSNQASAMCPLCPIPDPE
jgi:hypothetical protein